MNGKRTLYEVLTETKIVIPIIQRDYAQGREGKAFIRRTFLNEIKEHLNEDKSITLDFVYGNNEDNCFQPLDGQQRLTTLWLIHWYLSFKSGQLSEDKEWLKNFSYETRVSSSEFCKAICDRMAISNDVDSNKNISDYIKSQTWFYSEWLQDPTISAMLRTISGEFDNRKDDCIEGVFSDIDYGSYRNKLIDKQMVSFELMEIGSEKLPISDDLYVKMNARGKSLTNFENFKADFISWIQSEDNPERDEFKKDKEGNKDEKTYAQYYPVQIDNTWTDLFWKFTHENLGEQFKGNIDESFFSFINRFVLNRICLINDIVPSEFDHSKNKKENENKSHIKEKYAFDKLIGTGLDDDSLITYEGFDIYKDYLDFSTIEQLDRILSFLNSNRDALMSIQNALSIDDADDEDETSKNNQKRGYTFIPKYEIVNNQAKLLSTSQKERVYFLAICLFVNDSARANNFDEIKFKKWMRVAKNLIENAAIDNIPSMIICIRIIKALGNKASEFDWDIYKCLENHDEFSGDNSLDQQLNEEIEKAKIICSDPAWEEKIIDAERYSFFNGSIRFLYRDGKGGDDWNSFDTKLNKAKKLFDQNSNVVKTSTIESFLKLFRGFGDIEGRYLFTSVGYHARHKCWKKDILCKNDTVLIEKIDMLLKGIAETEHSDEYQHFLESGIISSIVNRNENYRYRYHWHYFWAIHKEYSQSDGVYVSDECRKKCRKINELIKQEKISLVDQDYNSYCNGYYWGLHIKLLYNKKTFNWYVESNNGTQEDRIYLVDEDGKNSKAYAVWDKSADLLQIMNNVLAGIRHTI